VKRRRFFRLRANIKKFFFLTKHKQLTRKQNKKKKEKNTLVVCGVSVMLASTLRLARRARTTHATPTSGGEAALFYSWREASSSGYSTLCVLLFL
jgi:hypothetical protein